jgi:Kef-type K+ transport system membrane component KefB/Trk K+ transport system NAD-binding subunit
MEFSLVNLLLVLLSAWIAGNLVSRLGYPSIFGELAAGIVLGPPLLGLLHSSEALNVLAELGVLLMMLYIGMEIDPKELFKASWGGMLAALGGFFTPFALVYLVVVTLGGTVAAGLFVGIAAGVTSLATKSRILVDLKLLDTRVAHVLMAGALISDTLALLVFAVIIGLFDASGLSVEGIVLVAGRAILFFGVVSFLGLKLFPPLWRRLNRAGLTGRTFNATLVLLLALLFAEFAELAGLHAILGAFLAGLFLREGTVLEPRLSHQLNELVHDVSLGFLAPIFFVTAGFHVSLRVFQSELLVLLVAVTLVATVGKIVGTALFYLPSGNGWREGLTVGAGMNGRGAVEIIIAGVGLELGVISAEIFSILVFMAIFTTATVPLLLKWTTDWLDSRGELVRAQDQRQGTLIMSAAPTARLLASALAKSEPVWLIDKNQYNCSVAEESGLNTICGDALDEEILEQANAAGLRRFLAITPNPEANVLAAQLARDVFLVPEVRVLLSNGDDSLHAVVEKSGIESIGVDWHEITEWDRRIEAGEVTTVVMDVDESQAEEEEGAAAAVWTKTFMLPIILTRNGQRIPFPAGETTSSGDQLLALRHEVDR